MRERSGLSAHADFLKLRSAQTISQAGSRSGGARADREPGNMFGSIVFGLFVVYGVRLGMLCNVNQLTLRQAITPATPQGRMNAIVAFSSARQLEQLPEPAGAADA